MYEIRAARLPPRPLADYETGNTAMPVMRDSRFDCLSIKVLPGEYCVTNADLVLITTLGSCVAACLRDAKAGVAGMNHFLLPDGTGLLDGDSARYGGYAMEKLINDLLQRGARRERLRAKLFGGAQVHAAVAGAAVGRRNAEFVDQFLERESIPVLARDLGGNQARKVYFWAQTGRALVHSLPRSAQPALDQEEGRYMKRLRTEPVGGTMELFTS